MMVMLYIVAGRVQLPVDPSRHGPKWRAFCPIPSLR
jgi:hypothetical protein